MNKDIKRRDEIIFGNYNPERYRCGGCVNIDVPASMVLQLVKEDFIDLDETQNCSPSTRDFLVLIEGVEDFAEFEIYAIDNRRDDYRVTIEGIHIEMPLSLRKRFLELVTEFGYADEFHVWEDDNENLCLRAWWD